MFLGAEACGRRKRRSLDQETIVLPDDAYTDIYIYDPPPFTSNEKTFPTTTGKTEKSAKKICNETIRNSLMGKSCIDTIKHFNIQSFIDQCVVDVRVSMLCIWIPNTSVSVTYSNEALTKGKCLLPKLFYSIFKCLKLIL